MQVAKAFRLELALAQTLEALATSSGRSQNEIVNAALEEYFRRQPGKAPEKEKG